MALEQDITDLVQAANNLTNVVDNKIGMIDQRVDQATEDLTVLGDGGIGSTVINAASFFTHVREASYLHFKLPWSVNTDNGMFHVHVRGYAYAMAELIDATFVGYVYKSYGDVIKTDVSGTHEPAIYKSADGSVYLRLTFADTYYLTVVADTTRVGDGAIIPRGAINIIASKEETL